MAEYNQESLNCLLFSWILVDNTHDPASFFDPRNERIYPEIDADYLLRSSEWFNLVSQSTATRIHAHPSNLTVGLLARGDRSLVHKIAQRWGRGHLDAVPWTRVAFAVRDQQRQDGALRQLHVTNTLTDGDWEAFRFLGEVFVYLSDRHEATTWEDVIYPRPPPTVVADARLQDILRASFNAVQIYLEQEAEEYDSYTFSVAHPTPYNQGHRNQYLSRLPPAVGSSRWMAKAQLQDTFELIRKKYKQWERSMKRAEERRRLG